jgi:pyruvate dehydrogenase E1 component beta subunit
MVVEANRAADFLSQQYGIECEVIDLHSISDPDRNMIVESVKKTGKLIVADTSWQAYGVSAEVCRIIAESCPNALTSPVKTIGLAPAPCPTGKTLEDLYYPNLTVLCQNICELVTGKADHGMQFPREESMADVYKKFKGPF